MRYFSLIGGLVVALEAVTGQDLPIGVELECGIDGIRRNCLETGSRRRRMDDGPVSISDNPVTMATNMLSGDLATHLEITNPELICKQGAAGYFDSLPAGHKFISLGIDGGGIALSSGLVTELEKVVSGSDSTSTDYNELATGDDKAFFANVGGDQDYHDHCILSFDAVVKDDAPFDIVDVVFSYVFASEEYLEFVGSSFNDLFVFGVNDIDENVERNVAIVPGTNEYVAINNVHTSKNQAYYSGPGATEFDGSTTLLTTDSIQLTDERPVTFRLGIADVSDGIYDSIFVIKASSLTYSSKPVAICKDLELQVNADCASPISFTAAQVDGGSFDDVGIVSMEVAPDVIVPSGMTLTKSIDVVLTVVDGDDYSSSCTATVTVVNQAPVAKCKDITIPATASCEGNIQLASNVDDGSSDPDNQSVELSVSDLGPFGLGDNDVTLTVADTCGVEATCVATITVEDQEPITSDFIDCGVGLGIMNPCDTPMAFAAAVDENAQKPNGCPVGPVITQTNPSTTKCQRCNGADKIVEPGCKVEYDGAIATVTSSGGVADFIAWTVTATDEAQTSATAKCGVCVHSSGANDEDCKGRILRGLGQTTNPFQCPPYGSWTPGQIVCPIASP